MVEVHNETIAAVDCVSVYRDKAREKMRQEKLRELKETGAKTGQSKGKKHGKVGAGLYSSGRTDRGRAVILSFSNQIKDEHLVKHIQSLTVYHLTS